jgi:CheY-like chemotaxis protein
VCLNDLLLELFSIFELKAKEKKIQFNLKKGLSDERSFMYTDTLKLNKILGNLLENALKFTASGFVEMGYQLRDNTIEIYVQDTGIGINSEKQEVIFERFSQEQKDLTIVYGGLGLGLSIAKENAELLGGKITLKSKKGEGATFYVTIPYDPAFPNGMDEGTPVSETEKISQGNGIFTILIAEDEEMNYLYLEALIDLIDADIKLLHARNGQDAIEMCKNNPQINIVLMDIKMPGMNGYEATKQIKKFRPDLPVIAQTAYSTTDDKDLAKSAGCDDFISKPIRGEALNQLITPYIGSSKG